LTKTLSDYEVDIKALAEYFFKVSDDLKNMESEITKKDTVESIKDKVMLKLNNLESESEKVSKKINDINLKLEKLKKEENDLYIIIKKRYPSLTDDQIKEEIHRRIS
jgi:hypothetical protein